MKVLQINSIYPVKSTGTIAFEIAEIQKKHGIEPYIVCGDSFTQDENVYEMNRLLYFKANIFKAHFFGKHGFYSKTATKKMLKWVDKIKPDVIHLHNIHGHYINIKLLFEYIKKNNIPVVWTLHDCWGFTGHCSHFDFIGCDKWKTGCYDCELIKEYPVSWLFDRSDECYRDKKALFTSVENMHITTPSDWMTGLCKESFLKGFPAETVNNGINLEKFFSMPSNLKKEMGLEDKFVIFAMVDSLNGTKGGQYLIELSKLLEADECIVLLSLYENLEGVPDNVHVLPRVKGTEALSRLYTMADVFVNPSLQESFSMVNLEAHACGTPVVTFNSGGVLDLITEKTGVVVDRADVKAMYDAIKRVKNGEFKGEDCVKRAQEFDYKKKFERFIHIYKDILDK